MRLPTSTTPGYWRPSTPRSRRSRKTCSPVGRVGLDPGAESFERGGEIEPGDGGIERWLKDRGEDPDLLLAAARLCLRNELWGKARSYLETVISLRPTPEAYREYGALLTQLGEADAAAEDANGGQETAHFPDPQHEMAV